MIKLCDNCSKEIHKDSTQFKTKRFCTKKCNKNFHRKKAALEVKVRKKRANLTQNKEVVYLIRQCKYAGTVQILSGHTLESFVETMELVRNKPKAKVHLCHVAPIKGKNTIGRFHCYNLFWGGEHQNKKFKNGYIAGGMSIRKKDLLKKWLVASDAKNNEVLILIEEYMPDIIQRYLEIAPVDKSKKVQAIKKIMQFDESKEFDELMQYSYNELRTICANLTKQKPWVLNNTTESKFLTYMDSLTRFINYEGERATTLKKLRKIMVIAYMALSRVPESETYNKHFYVKYEPLIDIKYGQAMLKSSDTWREFKDIIYDAAFRVLQGDSIDISKFRKLVMSYLIFPEKAFLDYGSTHSCLSQYSQPQKSNLKSFLYGSLILNRH